MIEAVAVQMCARKISAVAGDARAAIEVCRRAVEAVETDCRQQLRLKATASNIIFAYLYIYLQIIVLLSKFFFFIKNNFFSFLVFLKLFDLLCYSLIYYSNCVAIQKVKTHNCIVLYDGYVISCNLISLLCHI